tara:strand:+ start:164 stop:883 length:720 start_codon:yes stop_codon:yes gene_type:complete
MKKINITFYKIVNKTFNRLNSYFNSPKRKNEYTAKLSVQKRRSFFTFIQKNVNFLHSLELVKNNRLKGDIVEIGVLNGASLGQIHSIKEYLGLINNVYAFDTFEESHTGIKNTSKLNVLKEVTIPNLKNSGIEDPEKEINFVVGDVRDTLGSYKNKISFLHIDVDLPEIYEFVLNKIWSQMEVNSLTVFDEIYTNKTDQQRIEKKFGNLKNTVDTFLSDKNYEIVHHKQISRLIIKKID